MSKKHTIEEVEKILIDLGFILISKEYIDAHSKLIFKDKEGFLFNQCFHDITRFKNPLKFSISNNFTIDNIKLWLKQNNKNFELLDNKYVGTLYKMNCLCHKCNSEFKISWAYILDNQICPFCKGKQVNETNSLYNLNPKLSSEWNYERNIKLTPHNVTCNSGKVVWWKCNFSHEWRAQIASRNWGRNCPICKISHGEMYIQDYLIINKFNYLKEYKFDDLKGLGNLKLRFDFVVFENINNSDIKALIEFDGIQHSQIIKHWQTEEDFNRLKHHDCLKDKYCTDNNYPLIRISHDEINSINNILDKHLKNI